MRMRAVIQLLLIALVLPAPPAAAVDASTGELRRVRYGFTVRNTGAAPADADLWVRTPAPGGLFQTRTDLQASHPFEESVDDTGNSVARFTFPRLAPHATVVVRLEAALRMRDGAADAAATDPGPEPLTDHTADRFRALAPDLAAGAGPLPRRIFDWTRAHVRTIDYASEDRGALAALERRAGDCTEQAALFVALCRQHGIPARLLGGYVCPRDQFLRPDDFHHWAEFRWEGAWRVADPRAGLFMEGGEDRVRLRVHAPGGDPRDGFPRYRFEGRGITVTMDG
jgi:transglutaminase-like putative cysteine protease